MDKPIDQRDLIDHSRSVLDRDESHIHTRPLGRARPMHGNQHVLRTCASRVTTPELQPQRCGVGTQLESGRHVVFRVDLLPGLIGNNRSLNQGRLDHRRVAKLLIGETRRAFAKQIGHTEVLVWAADAVDFVGVGVALAVVVGEPDFTGLRVPVEPHRVAHPFCKNLRFTGHGVITQ